MPPPKTRKPPVLETERTVKTEIGLDADRTVIQGVRDLRAALDNRNACLIAISGSVVGKMFKISNNMVIGRSVDCEIFINDEGLSRQHAKITLGIHGGVFVTDLNSTNGTYYNGNPITSMQLHDGDKIQLGSTCILKFSYQDSLEEAFFQQQYDSATKDGLTGIYNRKYFLEQLQRDFSYAKRHHEPFTLIVFDIDHFKQINDTYGHPAGDIVLRDLTGLVSNAMRSEDWIARIGGEEFAIILRHVDEKRAHVMAERIRRTVEVHKFFIKEDRVKVTISLGVATLKKKNYPNLESLLSAADSFLYKAKESGRNRVTSSIRE